MQYANILLALAGDTGNTVPKRNVSAAEIAVLIAIHGEAAVTDIEPCEPIGPKPGSNRAELQRLRGIYGNAKDSDDNAVVDILFPGAAARVFETLDELDLDDSFFKAEARAVPAKRDPLDHDGDGRKGGTAPAAPPAEPVDALSTMTKAQLVEHAETNGIEIDPRGSKASILDAIRAAPTPADESEGEVDDEEDDGVGEMKDGAGDNLFR